MNIHSMTLTIFMVAETCRCVFPIIEARSAQCWLTASCIYWKQTTDEAIHRFLGWWIEKPFATNCFTISQFTLETGISSETFLQLMVIVPLPYMRRVELKSHSLFWQLAGPLQQDHYSRTITAGPLQQDYYSRTITAGPLQQDHYGSNKIIALHWSDSIKLHQLNNYAYNDQNPMNWSRVSE